MKTFVRAAESWVPNADRSLLEFGGGLYGDAPRFGALSRTLAFGRGEGLPGRAWEQGHPIVLKSFEGSYFQRTKAAHAEGLTCGIAMPIFAGDFLMAVLVLFCGDDEAHAGAIEHWANDPAVSRDMTLVDGYYGTTADAFEFISRRTSLRPGSGLPGMAWEAGRPVFMEDLGKGGRFLRADSAVKVGINRGLAIPCAGPDERMHVVAFLSALATPTARRMEIWQADTARSQLRRSSGFCETAGALGDTAPIEPGHGTIGRTLVTGVPGFSEHAGLEPGELGEGARAASLQTLAAVPVLRQGRVVATVAWYF